MKTSQAQKDKQKVRILDAAIQEFYAYGYSSASMRRIAQSADMAVSNIYRYYDSKSQLFQVIVAPLVEQILQVMDQFKNGTAQGISADENFLSELGKHVSQFAYDKKNPLLILFTRSYGSRYQNSRDIILQNFMRTIVQIAGMYGKKTIMAADRQILARILATSMVDTFIEILKHTKNRKELERAIKKSIAFHVQGLAAFLR